MKKFFATLGAVLLVLPVFALGIAYLFAVVVGILVSVVVAVLVLVLVVLAVDACMVVLSWWSRWSRKRSRKSSIHA